MTKAKTPTSAPRKPSALFADDEHAKPAALFGEESSDVDLERDDELLVQNRTGSCMGQSPKPGREREPDVAPAARPQSCDSAGNRALVASMKQETTARPVSIADVIRRCRERAAPYDRRAGRARAACGDEARERTERLWEGVHGRIDSIYA